MPTTLADFEVTDDVSDVLAAQYNRLLGSIFRGDMDNATTMSGTVTLADSDVAIQRFNCDGANRIVKMPAAADANHPFFIVNVTAATYTLDVQSNGGVTILSTPLAANGGSCLVMPDGTAGYKVVGAAPTWGTISGTLSDQTDLQAILSTGWIDVSDTWTYASATTFTVSGDQTATFFRSVKIRLTQTTVKYFSVIKSTYSAPDTTVTISGGSDYTLANAAITSPAYAVVENPESFPAIFNWSPTFTGFSANPTGTYRFRVLPTGLFVDVQQSANGTSNANDFTITPPPGVTLLASARLGLLQTAVDNTAAVTTTPGIVATDAGATAYVLSKDFSGVATGWTTSGGKRARFTLLHDIG